MGRTLFQMLKGKTPVEFDLYNPLHMRLGQLVQIDQIDIRGKNYKVTGLREYNRQIEGHNFQSVDYDLIAYCNKPDKIRIRLNPLTNPDPASGLTHNVVILSLYYECGYQLAKDTGLDKAVGESDFCIDWNGENVKYYRIDPLLTASYVAKLKILEDCCVNDHKEDNKIVEQNIEYYDYHTELKDEAGQPYISYLFVEQNADDGFWQIWRGSEIIPEKVTVV